MSAMPAAFIGHGNPMNALETNRYTASWAAFGESVGHPRAVLCVSAHWYVNATAVTAMPTPRVIHDFYGFPQALFDFDYPAPGSPEVAHEVADVAEPVWIGMDADSWGIDHGTWSVLAHMFPAVDIPVVQLSIDASKPFDYHVDLGARLAPLLESGVLIVASGNVVHNLRRIDWNAGERGYDWAQRFDDAARGIMTERPGDVATLLEHPDFAAASPTPDHFLPLAYLAGIAAATGRVADVLVDGCTMGSLSMTAYTVGTR
jgi:4,5-DOPA dioxygenase extradiol